MNSQHSSQPTHHLRTAIRSLLPLGALGMPALALAGGPTGEVIVGGDVEVNRPNGNTTVIDQASWRAIVDWQSFNVGLDEYVLFNQPGANAVILNRVVGGDPTSILGSLTSNGQVFLVNPQGIFFGQSATLDVGGLLATTLDVSNENFMAGNYSFTKTGSGPDAGVVNEGRINADGGYVVLAADHVSNSGVVAARAGHVVMAAGSAFTLDIEGDGLVNFAVDEAALSDMAGVSNAGTILADGGVVLMTAKVANDLVATAVNNEGLIQAHSISEQDGVIYLAAEGGDIVNAGTLDANGVGGEDGGGIMLHGDANIDLKDGSVITAAGSGAASGGVIRVIAEDTLYFRENATIRATGGDANGGFVEVSGHQDLELRGLLDIGQGGQLLIDPTSMSISAANNGTSVSTSQVGTVFIEQQLNDGVDVAIVATTNIRVSSGNPGTSITAAGGTGDLFMGIGTISVGSGTGSTCALNGGLCIGTDPELLFTPGTGGNISLAGFDISILGDFAVEGGAASAPIVSLGDVTAANISIRSTSLNIGRLTATSNVTIMGDGGAFMQFDDGVGGTIAIDAGVNINISGAGTLRLGNGTFGDGSWFGQAVNAGGNITINAGRVYSGDMTATGGDIIINASSGQIFFGTATGSSSNPVFTFADVSAGGMVKLTATKNEPFDIVEVRVNNVTGTAVDIQANNTASYGGGALIRTGDVTATTDSVLLQANHGAGDNSVSIDAGKITAATTITVEAIANAGASIGGHIVAGALSGEEIFVHHDGNKADISLGSITAINNNGVARVNVITGDGFGVTQAGNITVNGDITVSGEAVTDTSCGFSDNCFGAFGQPVAAQVQLRSGEFGGTSDTAPLGGVITVNGGIDITANLANVTVESSGGESAITNTVTGQAGLAELLIAGAVADVSDSIAVTGPDAGMTVTADQVRLGAVSVTGSGHDMTFTHVNSFGSATDSFSSTNNAGHAMLRISGYYESSAATSVDLGGAVTVSGIGLAAVDIQTQDLNAQSITVDAATATYDRSMTGDFSSSPSSSLVTQVFEAARNGGVFDINNGPIEIDEGTLTVGFAAIRLTGSITGGSGCSSVCLLPVDQLTINGDLSANGVGQADIFVAATDLTITGGITATAAAGTVDGTGQNNESFGSGSSTNFYDAAITQQGDIGQAHVELLSDSGSISVGGDITISGLVGGLDITAKEGTLSVHGISVTGTGGVLHTTKAFTPTGSVGTSFNTSFTGPTERTMVGIIGDQVTINGDVDVSGPGIVGLMIAAFSDAPVINGNVTLTATNATVTELDTRDSPTATTITYGDVAFLTGQFSSTETAIAPADINGNVTINAARDAHLLFAADIRDALIVNADRNIDTNLPSVFQDEEDPDAIPEVPLAVTAGGLGLAAGGTINLTGATLDVDTSQNIAITVGGSMDLGTGTFTANGLTVDGGADVDFTPIVLDITGNGIIDLAAAGNLQLGSVNFDTTGMLTMNAGGNIISTTGSMVTGGLGLAAGGDIDFGNTTLNVNNSQNIAVVANGSVNFGNATLETTQLLSVVAGGNIANGSGSFTADGLALISNASINMQNTTFAIGDGVFPDIPGDALLLLGLGMEGLAPPSSSPNATFVAGTGVHIGALSVDGGYAWFETHDVTFNGAVTGPANLLVQFTPFGGLGNVIINGDSGEEGGAKQAISGLNLSLSDLRTIQDGATIVIGTSDYTGSITIDAINIDGRNFVAATEGTIDSLDNITSTGKVKNLSELLAVGLFEQPGLDEINADYYNNPLGDDSETGEEEGEDTDGDGTLDTEGDNALIKHDSSGETKVCAG